MSTKQTRTTKSKRVNGKRVTPVTEQPASQRVEAPPCPVCPPDNRDRTYITSKHQTHRYCKCRRCGWHWRVDNWQMDLWMKSNIATTLDVETR